ncbi:hypothetical protein TrVE_jg6655 [Triparma verrucosa]|uniref:G domain-containing protein n=1 Tax=Triparma verrucosa TaxID=1606542 RepID=A0A9W7B1V3_9STRA|nr:hypothetical protein TrVE_jg6655 [Triparma verrucosa]
MYLLNRCSPLKPRFTPRFTPHSVMLRSNPNRSFPSHCSSRLYSTSNSNSDDELPPTGPPINWYPGHISSAENQLEKTLSTVDLILEIRDSRAIQSTSHPKIESWSLGVQRIIICSKSDLIPEKAIRMWKDGNYKAFKNPVQKELTKSQREIKKNKMQSTSTTSTIAHVQISDIRLLKVHDLKRKILSLSKSVNEKRVSRGLLKRSVRVAVVGFPNTGKSMVINKLVGRRIVKSQNTPGVTRQLHWVKIKGTSHSVETASGVVSKENKESTFELLDTPGIIPTKLVSDVQGNVLAVNGLVGEKGYDNVNVASSFLERIRWIIKQGLEDVCCPDYRKEMKRRYGLDIMEGERGMKLYEIADESCKGDLENAAVKVIQDFRQGRMGKVCLEVPEEEEWGEVEEEIYEEVDEKAEEREEKRRALEEEGRVLPKKEEGTDPYKRFDGW